MKRQRRPKLRIGKHYMMIDGVKTEINIFETHIPDICKLMLASMITGEEYELVEDEANQ